MTKQISRNNPLMLTMTTSIRKSRFLPVLALVFPLVASQATAFGAKLERIEFTPSSTVTDIQLHSESALPYHIAFSSDNKLMIDLDNVTNDGTIDTQFLGVSESSIISNVILQPLSDHSLRIIIRGERLAPPHIGFTQTRAETASHKTAQAAATAPLIPESLGEDINLDNTPAQAKAPIAPITHQAPGKPKINQTGIGKDLDIIPASSELDVKRPPTPAESSFINSLLTPILATPFLALAPYGVIAILLLGLGIFLYNKIKSMSQNKQSFDTLIEQQSQGQAIGFRQLANAYRDENQQATTNREQPAPIETRQDIAKNGDSLIGLGRLSQLIDSMAQNQPQIDIATQADAQAKAAKLNQQRIEQSLQQLKQTPPAVPAAPKAPSRQAAQQYAQSDRQSGLGKAKQQKPANAANSSQNLQRRPLGDEQLRQELKRAADMNADVNMAARQRVQQQSGQLGIPKNRSIDPLQRQRQEMPAKQSKGEQKAPLSGNPEVLNFLKNVADLMEKDGRTGQAQSFRSKTKQE